MNTLHQLGLGLIAITTIATSTQSFADSLRDQQQQQKNNSSLTSNIIITTKTNSISKGNNLNRSCDSTARGIRCKNRTAITTDFIATLEKPALNQYKTQVGKQCILSPRGTRCMIQTQTIASLSIAEMNLFSASADNCQTKSRGLRCYS